MAVPAILLSRRYRYCAGLGTGLGGGDKDPRPPRGPNSSRFWFWYAVVLAILCGLLAVIRFAQHSYGWATHDTVLMFANILLARLRR